MRNEVILLLSDIFESYAKTTAVNMDLNPTEEEKVAALVAAAFGLCQTSEGYEALNTAVKAAQLLMDRVRIPYDGHYIELEAAYQRRRGHPSPTEQARLDALQQLVERDG